MIVKSDEQIWNEHRFRKASRRLEAMKGKIVVEMAKRDCPNVTSHSLIRNAKLLDQVPRTWADVGADFVGFCIVAVIVCIPLMWIISEL